MKKFQKITSALMALTLSLSIAACSGKTAETPAPAEESEKTYSIGISQYGEHASLDNCREGFLQGLAQAGIEEGVNLKVDYQNAGFDDNIAAQIGQ